MYLRHLTLENVGPIERAEFDLPFGPNDRPKPLVLVGTNGAGKSIALSFIANALSAMQQALFQNADVQAGRVYKLRHPNYIRAGAKYYRMQATFDHGINMAEWQLSEQRDAFEASLDESTRERLAALPGFGEVRQDATSTIAHSFREHESVLRADWSKQVALWFPADRHELPAWLNEADMTYRPKHSIEPKIEGRTDRRLVRTVAMKEVMDWILGVALDSRMKPKLFNLPNVGLPVFLGYEGAMERDLVALLSTVLRVGSTKNAVLNVGTRHQRAVGRNFYDEAGNHAGSNTLLSMSSGEAQLFVLFASILMDYDKTGAPYTSMEDVRGIVVVDEVDLHLHIELQRDVLPALLKRFPLVQFVLTTHSPLLLLGLEQAFGSDGFQLLKMPNAEPIAAEAFSEFDMAFQAFQASATCRAWADTLKVENKPLLLTEGKTDALLISTAWKKLYPGADMPFLAASAGADGRGGAKLLNAQLMQISFWPSKIAGLFDRDQAGCDQYSGLKEFTADASDPDVSRHPTRRHLALLLPIPPDRTTFWHSRCGEQGPWHLEIEHYFPNKILIAHGLARQVDEANAGRPFELYDKPKSRFAEAAENFDASTFESFRGLFDKLRNLGFINHDDKQATSVSQSLESLVTE